MVDFAAASLFIAGSILFFFETTMLVGTWAFLVGSVCFALKPAIRLARELWLAKLHDIGALASDAPEGPGALRVHPEDHANDPGVEPGADRARGGT